MRQMDLGMGKAGYFPLQRTPLTERKGLGMREARKRPQLHLQLVRRMDSGMLMAAERHLHLHLPKVAERPREPPELAVERMGSDTDFEPYR